jgi:Domain of Unknown Function (DUF1080)
MRAYILCACALMVTTTSLAARNSMGENDRWTPLFNGKNFDGWYTFLPSTGKNDDPKGVFKVEHGMIHILDIPESNEFQEFGYLATDKEFSHCRIRAEFKWGTKRFVPRAEDKRDSGLLYYFVGPDKVWPRSLELQIQETDVGDLWITDGPRIVTSVENEYLPMYSAGVRPHHQSGGRVIKAADLEDRTGWNTVEAVLDGNRITHIVNGRVVMRAWNLKQPDPQDSSKWIAFDRGRILLQAEGSEVWFRNIQVKPFVDTYPTTNAALQEHGSFSVDSPVSRLLADSGARNLLKVLLSEDTLTNPLLEHASDITGRWLISYLLTPTDEQMQALDNALRALPPQ